MGYLWCPREGPCCGNRVLSGVQSDVVVLLTTYFERKGYHESGFYPKRIQIYGMGGRV